MKSEPPTAHKVASGPTRPKLDIASVVMAVLLVLWGASGLVNDKLVLGKGSTKMGFTNGSAWLVAAALFCGAAVLLIAALPPAAKELKSISGIRWPSHPPWLVPSSRSTCLADLSCVDSMSQTLRPNPSLEPTRSGVALGPRGRFTHHRPRGPSATPALAAQLKR